MKTALKSVFLVTALFLGTGVKAEVAERAETPVWGEFASAWEKRVASDARIAQLWQQLQQSYQQIAQTPYEISEIYLGWASFRFYKKKPVINDPYEITAAIIREVPAIVPVIADAPTEAIIFTLKEIISRLPDFKPGQDTKNTAFLLNNCPVTDVLLLSFRDHMIYSVDGQSCVTWCRLPGEEVWDRDWEKPSKAFTAMYTKAWKQFCTKWHNKVKQDPAMNKAWQEVFNLFKEIAKTPYEMSEIHTITLSYMEIPREEMEQQGYTFKRLTQDFDEFIAESFQAGSSDFITAMNGIATRLRQYKNDPIMSKQLAFLIANLPLSAPAIFFCFHD